MTASDTQARRAQARRGEIRPMRRSRFWWYASKWAVLLFSKLWFRHRREGSEQVPAEGPVLLVANHASYLDPPMVGISTKREVNFLAQAGLAVFPPLRWWLAQVGVTLIDRDAPSKDALRMLGNSLRAGEVVGIFPEGTRSKDGSVAPFKSGVEFLVRRTKATVVPIGIDGTFRAMNRRMRLPRPRKVVVRFGAPWTPEQVLAEGGVERLRREVAALARCPLREERGGDDGRDAAPGTPAATGDSAGSGKGPTAGMVDPTEPSASASAGGGPTTSAGGGA